MWLLLAKMTPDAAANPISMSHLLHFPEPVVACHGEEEVLRNGRGLRLCIKRLVNHVHLRAPRDGGVCQVRLEVGIRNDQLSGRRKAIHHIVGENNDE